MVTPERTGFRDERISMRHRLWGVSCQATDIDFLLLEYYFCYGIINPVALIEYKRKSTPKSLRKNMQFEAYKALCDRASLPSFVVYYSDDLKSYDVFANNNWAKVRLKGKYPIHMTEREYVIFLHKLRNIDEVPESVWRDIEQADLALKNNQAVKQSAPKIQTNLFEEMFS